MLAIGNSMAFNPSATHGIEVMWDDLNAMNLQKMKTQNMLKAASACFSLLSNLPVICQRYW